MSIRSVLANGAVKGALAFLSELLGLLHSQFVAGGAADDETRKALKTFMVWYPEIRAGARRTDTQYDDTAVEEVRQFAIGVLGQAAWDEARTYDGPEDTDPPEADAGPTTPGG